MKRKVLVCSITLLISSNVIAKQIEVPQDFVETACRFGSVYDVEPSVFVAIAYHERGVVSFKDDYVFGIGLTDHVRIAEYAGLETQWNVAGNRIGEYFMGKDVSATTFQNFARTAYKTTEWENYGNVYYHYLKLKDSLTCNGE